MLEISTNGQIYIFVGRTNLRNGIPGLSLLAQAAESGESINGIYIFRGRRADRIKILWWDGQGFCLLYKVTEHGRFVWPSNSDNEVITIDKNQFSLLIKGLDWHNPEFFCAPSMVG